MTEEEKTQTEKTISLYKWITGIATLILGIALTAFITDVQATKDDMKNKASIEYVDKKCQDTKDEIKAVLDNIEEQQRISNQDIKEILKSMPRK